MRSPAAWQRAPEKCFLFAIHVRTLNAHVSTDRFACSCSKRGRYVEHHLCLTGRRSHRVERHCLTGRPRTGIQQIWAIQQAKEKSQRIPPQPLRRGAPTWPVHPPCRCPCRSGWAGWLLFPSPQWGMGEAVLWVRRLLFLERSRCLSQSLSGGEFPGWLPGRTHPQISSSDLACNPNRPAPFLILRALPRLWPP